MHRRDAQKPTGYISAAVLMYLLREACLVLTVICQ